MQFLWDVLEALPATPRAREIALAVLRGVFRCDKCKWYEPRTGLGGDGWCSAGAGITVYADGACWDAWTPRDAEGSE